MLFKRSSTLQGRQQMKKKLIRTAVVAVVGGMLLAFANALSEPLDITKAPRG